MSTKIYGGVRFPVSRLGEFIEFVRLKGLLRVEREARALLEKFPESPLTKDDRKTLAVLAADKHADFHRERKISALLKAIHLAAVDPHRSHLDLHQGWNLWFAPDGKHILGSPFGSAWPGESRKSIPKWAEDYGYWDNTDQPDHVSARAWRKRELDWEVACAPSYQQHKLVVYVFDARESRYTIDLAWLDLRLRNHKTDGKRFGKPGTWRDYAKFSRQIERDLRIRK